jgi:hypothetical protein
MTCGRRTRTGSSGSERTRGNAGKESMVHLRDAGTGATAPVPSRRQSLLSELLVWLLVQTLTVPVPGFQVSINGRFWVSASLPCYPKAQARDVVAARVDTEPNGIASTQLKQFRSATQWVHPSGPQGNARSLEWSVVHRVIQN